MRKTSVYLPDHLKRALAVAAATSGRSEAEVLRAAVESAVRPAGVGSGVGPGPGSAAAPAEPPVAGRLVGVGVGPGDPDLVTVRAVVVLRRADRVLAPATAVDAVGRAELIVRQAVPGVRIERIPFDMSPDRAARDRSIAAAARTVAAYLDEGEVAFITLGDPLTYSTFSSVAAAVKELRPSTVVTQVPGIMAFQALAARTGTTVTDESQRLVVRTALGGEDVHADLDDPRATVVLYKGGRRLPELAAAAMAAGRLEGAVAGELLGMPGERVGSLADVAADGPASYLATVIVPAGPNRPPTDRGPATVTVPAGPNRPPTDPGPTTMIVPAGPNRPPADPGPAPNPRLPGPAANPRLPGPSASRPLPDPGTGPSVTPA